MYCMLHCHHHHHYHAERKRKSVEDSANSIHRTLLCVSSIVHRSSVARMSVRHDPRAIDRHAMLSTFICDKLEVHSFAVT